MTPEPPKIIQLDEIEAIPGPGSLTWRPVRLTLGVRAFGCNAYSAGAAGEDVVEPHTEDPKLAHQELYFVARGRATFTIDGESHDAPAGTYVFIPDPASHRHAVAAEAGTTVLSFGSPRRTSRACARIRSSGRWWMAERAAGSVPGMFARVTRLLTRRRRPGVAILGAAALFAVLPLTSAGAHPNKPVIKTEEVGYFGGAKVTHQVSVFVYSNLGPRAGNHVTVCLGGTCKSAQGHNARLAWYSASFSTRGLHMGDAVKFTAIAKSSAGQSRVSVTKPLLCMRGDGGTPQT